MTDSLKGQGQKQQYFEPYPNGNGGRVSFHSRIGTKLIVGFLIIACITGSVGYFSLNYSQIVGEKFDLLVLHSLPAIDSLKPMELATLKIESATNDYVFTPGMNRDNILQEIEQHKNNFSTNLNKYEAIVNKYFPDQTDLNESIGNAWNVFIQNSNKLVQLRQSAPSSATILPAPLEQQALSIKEHFQDSEEALFQSIDNVILNEVRQVENRINDLDAAISTSSLVTLTSIVISVIVAVGFGLFFSRYISRPISNLKQASIQIGMGDHVTACKYLSKTHRSDEIGKLSSEIEKMRQSIESMKTNLDKLVEQRTKELEIKNEQLLERETDLERANQELVRTELAKEEFMSMVSHELKTPLTPLKMYSEMFLKTTALGNLDEKQNKVMKLMRNNISKLELLVNDIMDVYKLDIGKLRLNKRVVEVTKIVKDNVSDLAPLMGDKEIEFKTVITPPADKLAVLCDPERIGQVITNLVKNSVDFVPDKTGKVTIRVAIDNTNDSILFSVQDNGAGIPSDKVDNLFKSFYQIDTTVRRKHGGTGLGLAICKGIIEGHGGKIWVDRNYTQGTSINFTLRMTDTSIPAQNYTSKL